MPAARYLREATNPILVTVATAKATEVGDIVGLASNTLVKASDEAWDTNLATTQTNFAAKFVGIATQKKTNTQDRPYGQSEANTTRVDTSGVYEFDCASATFEVGDYVGPAKDTGNALLDNKVVGVSGEGLAIGRVVERGTSITRVKVRILSQLAGLSQLA